MLGRFLLDISVPDPLIAARTKPASASFFGFDQSELQSVSEAFGDVEHHWKPNGSPGFFQLDDCLRRDASPLCDLSNRQFLLLTNGFQSLSQVDQNLFGRSVLWRPATF